MSLKEYKIDLSGFTGKVREVVSEAVQKKAFELGYEWVDTGAEVFDPGVLNVIYFTGLGKMHGPAYGGNKKNTKEITAADFLALESAKDEPEFKPFDKVLVRDDMEWIPEFYAGFEDGYYRTITRGAWRHCIPYEGNEHLVGTKEKA
jgi:hypothetical protein